MSVAKVTEISASSSKSFDDAMENGIERANKRLDRVPGGQYQFAGQDAVGHKALAEVLVEPTRSNHIPGNAAGLDHFFGALRPFLSTAGKQDNVLQSTLDRQLHECL